MTTGNSPKLSDVSTRCDVVVGNTDDKGRTVLGVEVFDKSEGVIETVDHVRIDSGFTAWSQVIVGHLIVFNVGGYGNAFGIFQAYYTNELNYSPSSVSWIGSIQMFLTLFGTFSGRLTDEGYYWSVIVSGLFLQILAAFMTSFSNKYYQFLLAQGICQGLGNALVFTPTIAMVSTYFLKKRSFAVAGVASGTATGGVVFTVVARYLISHIGFAWTVRVMASIMLFNAVVALIFARPIRLKRKPAPIVELSAFKDPWFSFLGLGLLLALVGQYVGYFYMASFAEDVVHVSSDTALDMLLVANSAGLPGRLIPAWLADHVTGPLNMEIILVCLTGILLFVWTAIHSIGGIWAFAAVYGFVASAIQGLAAPSLACVKSDPVKFGVRMGMIFTIMSIGVLCGPPLAGIFVERDGGKYLYGQLFGGIVMVLGATVLAIPRLLTTGFSFFAKC